MACRVQGIGFSFHCRAGEGNWGSTWSNRGGTAGGFGVLCG